MSLNLSKIFDEIDHASMITKLLCFSDNRVHAAFEDQTSLIIHAGNSNLFRFSLTFKQ